MNFSEFKKRLGADPRDESAEMLEARQSDPEFEQAAADALAFEQKLNDALSPPIDTDAVLERVLRLPDQRRTWSPQWLAMAASVLLVVGLTGTFWYLSGRPRTIEQYVSEHYAFDGDMVMARASDQFDTAEVNALLAQLDTVANRDLVGRVRFIKFCPTPHGPGAHMIVSTASGLVTVLFMPDARVSDGETMNFDGHKAELVALKNGAAAIIGTPDQRLADLEPLVRSAIQPVAVGA